MPTRFSPFHPVTLILALLVGSIPTTALSAGISIANLSSTGQSTTLLAPGDVLTVDLVLNNNAALEIYGLGLAVAGYDKDRNGIADDGLVYIGGTGTDSVLNGTLIHDPNDPGNVLTSLGGLANRSTTPWEFVGGSRETPSSPFVNQGLGVEFMGGISLAPTNGDGSQDFGIGGQLVQDGDVHFRLQFQATPQIVSNQITLEFGIPLDQFGNSAWGAAVVGTGGQLYDFDNETLALFNDSLVLTVVPEPSTGLLVGLGLAAMATRRRTGLD